MNYRIGSVIEYRPFGGHGGGTRRVIVETKADDIKNGRPGFDGRLETGQILPPGGTGVWGYDDQITRVLMY